MLTRLHAHAYMLTRLHVHTNMLTRLHAINYEVLTTTYLLRLKPPEDATKTSQNAFSGLKTPQEASETPRSPQKPWTRPLGRLRGALKGLKPPLRHLKTTPRLL